MNLCSGSLASYLLCTPLGKANRMVRAEMKTKGKRKSVLLSTLAWCENLFSFFFVIYPRNNKFSSCRRERKSRTGLELLTQFAVLPRSSPALESLIFLPKLEIFIFTAFDVFASLFFIEKFTAIFQAARFSYFNLEEFFSIFAHSKERKLRKIRSICFALFNWLSHSAV